MKYVELHKCAKKHVFIHCTAKPILHIILQKLIASNLLYKLTIKGDRTCKIQFLDFLVDFYDPVANI